MASPRILPSCTATPSDLIEALHEVHVPVEQKSVTYYHMNAAYIVCDHITIHGTKFDLVYLGEEFYGKKGILRCNPYIYDQIAYDNDINLITVTYDDYYHYGAHRIAAMVKEKITNRISPTNYDPEKVSCITYPRGEFTRVEVFYQGEYRGEVTVRARKTICTVIDWCVTMDPYWWVDSVCHAVGSPTWKVNYHPYDCRPVSLVDHRREKITYGRYNKVSDCLSVTLYRSKGIMSARKVRRDPPARVDGAVPWCHRDWHVVSQNNDFSRKNACGPRVYDNDVLMKKIVPREEWLNLSTGSHLYCEFVCPEGHHYWAQIKEQLKYGCNICSGDVVVLGINDLATTHPGHAARWDYDKNFPYTPHHVTAGSVLPMWWIDPVYHLSYNYPVLTVTTMPADYSPLESGTMIVPGVNDVFTRTPQLEELFSPSNKVDCHQLTSADYSTMYTWSCDTCHNTWKRTLATMLRHPHCQVCNGEYGKRKCSSIAEREVFEFIRTILPTDTPIVTHDRSVLQGKELDILIPDHHMAVEYNGLYWHDEHHVDNNYHYSKWKQCQEQGIQLLTIWEDDWRDRKHVVQSMLKSKLHATDDATVYARTTRVEQIDATHAQRFLDDCHIQGYVAATVHFGLVDATGALVAVASFGKQGDVLYLHRYATRCHVPGGVGKLVRAGCRYGARHECTRLVTFSDNCVSDGHTYRAIGMRVDTTLRPDYSYIHVCDTEIVRHHKFGFRKKRFRNDPHLKYRDGLTERELAALNDLARVYDCGKIRWVLDIAPSLAPSGHVQSSAPLFSGTNHCLAESSRR